MLTDIYIENYTIVDRLHLKLATGLSVLSGETGAGKSIIVDAVMLTLGARIDNKIIRPQQTRCNITLCFDISKIPLALTWLTQHDFDEQQECIISRTIHQDGRSRITINGKPCPAIHLRELAGYLLVIYGQHQSQTLLQQEQQQHYIDAYGMHDELLQALQNCYFQWRTHEVELSQLRQQMLARQEQLSFLHYQLEELEAMNLQPGEWQQLHQEHQQLHNAQHLLTHLNQAIDLTVENENTSTSLLLQHALDQLRTVSKQYPSLQEAIELLNTAAIHIQEAGDELAQHRDTLLLNPERLNYVEQRLTQIHDIARKHHVTAEALPDVIQSIKHNIAKLTTCEERIETLQQHNEKLLANYHTHAKNLSKSRQRIANEVSHKITDYMQTLGMQGGQFAVQLELQQKAITPNGNEKIIFMIKTNPGLSIQPLAKVVSGGELSRISLALQTILSEKDNIPTFIFDEVDVGIGGQTAEIVGKLLKDLGQKTQVFCITHLPQVAAQGNQHYKVEKFSTEDSTTATIIELTEKQRIEELARMISGSKITKQTLQHAKALLS